MKTRDFLICKLLTQCTEAYSQMSTSSVIGLLCQSFTHTFCELVFSFFCPLLQIFSQKILLSRGIYHVTFKDLLPFKPTFLWFKAGLYKQTSCTFWLNQSKFSTKSDLIFFCNIKLVFGQRQNNVNKTLAFKKWNSETNSVANSWIICSKGGWGKSSGVETRKREQRKAMKEDTRKRVQLSKPSKCLCQCNTWVKKWIWIAQCLAYSKQSISISYYYCINTLHFAKKMKLISAFPVETIRKML